VALVLLLLLALCAWFVRARLVVYETSPSARVEVARAASPVDAAVAGRVVDNRMQLGKLVHTGDLLVLLDAQNEQKALVEAQARVSALEGEIASLGQVIAAFELALDDDRLATLSAVGQARSEALEARVTARIAEAEALRARQLHTTGALSERELARAEAEAERSHAARTSRSLSVARERDERRTRHARAAAELADLRRELIAADAQRHTALASIELFAHRVAQKRIVAPIDGSIGDIAEMQVGAYVSEGDKLGAIVPRGELKIVAMFEPGRALGRIKPGQPARAQLDGFSWLEHGFAKARVSQVASELRDKHVRVELEVLEAPRDIELVHGLQGQLEIEVERTTPLSLVLRNLGKVLRDTHSGAE
jgi:multidrug resistance efflux pump